MAAVIRNGRPLRVHALIDSLNWGGAETLLADFAAGAPAADIDLSVGYLQDVNGSPSAAALRAHGIEPELVGVRKLLDAESMWRVGRHIARVRPDILHTHLGAADVQGTLAARSLRVPSVSTIHLVAPPSMPWAARREAARERLMATARRHGSRRVLAVSEAARVAYLRAGLDESAHVVTVHNGISVRTPSVARASTRAKLGLAPDAPVIAMASVLRAGKGHSLAFEAVRHLLPRYPDLRLLVAGDGPARDAVAAEAADLGATVLLLGFRRDVLDLLAASDVLLLPSRMDAFPTNLLEAAAVGVPSVATAVGGIPEIVQDGRTGMLVQDPPTVPALVQALDRLLGDEALRRRMGAAARERFATHFTAEHWAQRCRAVYDEILQSR
jgi:glycosyltransferase involved in cell wall biosynthesis